MALEEIILIGFGGHAKVVTDTIEQSGIYRIVGYIEKNEIAERDYRGYHVIGNDDDLQELYDRGIRNAFVTVGFMGRSDVRRRLYERLKKIGYTLPTIVDKSAVLAKDVNIGEGVYVGKNAVVNANTTIGKMSIINTAAIVEHDSVIGEFSHLAIGAVACGNVTIDANTFIGSNATIIQGTGVGNDVIVGAGTVVLSDVSDKQTVYGLWK